VIQEKVSAEVVANRKRWLERLERNEDPQTYCELRKDDAMCCLGVGWYVVDGRWSGPGITGIYVAIGSRPGVVLPPPEFWAMFGFDDGFMLQRLARRNDGTTDDDPTGLGNFDHCWTFPEIAALLRSDDWFGPDLDRVVR
jgi:hypothetical protein